MRRRLALGLAVAMAAGAALPACAPRTDDPCVLDGPGAGWLAYASRRTGNYDLRLVRADGTCDGPLTSDPGDDLSPAWSPTGELAWTAVRADGVGIRVLDLPTGVERALDVGALHASSPAFSPDGSLIAFEAHAPGTTATDVYVVAAAGGTPTRLTDHAADDAGPAWSPDGATVYFVSVRTGWYDVFAVPAGGGAAVQVTTRSGILGRPAVAPDGHALAWTRVAAETGLTEVVRLDLDTLATTVLTGADDSEPAFDAAGGHLAVRTLRYGNPEIAVLDLAGTASPHRLTLDEAADGLPAFAPPGTP